MHKFMNFCAVQQIYCTNFANFVQYNVIIAQNNSFSTVLYTPY